MSMNKKKEARFGGKKIYIIANQAIILSLSSSLTYSILCGMGIQNTGADPAILKGEGPGEERKFSYKP